MKDQIFPRRGEGIYNLSRVFGCMHALALFLTGPEASGITGGGRGIGGDDLKAQK